MLSATDQYRSKVMDQVRKSTERLSRVRNGTSLSNALDQQGLEVKRRFMESRRISDNILHEIYDDYAYQQNPVDHEESREYSELLDHGSSSKTNSKVIVNNKAAFRFLPELEQKLAKNEADNSAPKPSELELLLKKAPTFTQSKSVPRLRGLSLEDNYKKGPSADELNKEIMTRIWREEHESAISKLKQLQAQQKLQAITDMEASEKKRGKNDSLTKSQDLGQSAVSAVIVKSSFKGQAPVLEKSINMADSNRSEVELLKNSMRRKSSSVLKFRRDLTPEALRPNMKKISQNLKTFRLGQVAEVITIHDIPKAQGNKRERKIEYLNNSPKRVQIRFVPSTETHQGLSQRDTTEIPNLMNKAVAVTIPKTKNSVDYSMGVMRENMKFLERERDITQHKLTIKSKDDSGNMTDLRMEDNRLYRKWPLASNSHSLNDDSVQGSDYVDRQSHSSLGETTFLIKKYENYNSGRNEKMPTYGEKSKIETLGNPIEIVSNVSHNISYLSRGVTSLNSSQNDLKPKFQRSISQI